jgi:flagellar FliJ protein
MRRFSFPLQTLLKVRKLREREAKRKVAAQRAEIARLDQLNQATWAEISAQHATLLQNQQHRMIEPTDLARARAWIAHLQATVAQRTLLRSEMTARLQELQSEFVAARQQALIIEKLRQRRWDDYRRQRDRKEQAASDELAQQLQTQTGVESSVGPPRPTYSIGPSWPTGSVGPPWPTRS